MTFKTRDENYRETLIEARQMTRRNILIALQQRAAMHEWAVCAYEDALKERTHLTIPVQFREQYMQAASFVWNYIAGDCPGAENYSKRTIVEIVRDAGRIGQAKEMGCFGLTPEFQTWIKEHQYDPLYSRDMNRAVAEVI